MKAFTSFKFFILAVVGVAASVIGVIVAGQGYTLLENYLSEFMSQVQIPEATPSPFILIAAIVALALPILLQSAVVLPAYFVFAKTAENKVERLDVFKRSMKLAIIDVAITLVVILLVYLYIYNLTESVTMAYVWMMLVSCIFGAIFMGLVYGGMYISIKKKALRELNEESKKNRKSKKRA